LSTQAKIDLEQQFNSSVFTSDTQYLDEWFSKLEGLLLQIQLDFEVDIDNMIIHIFYNIKAKLYDTVIALIKRDIQREVKIDL
jgi:hypothetical protein